MTRLHQTQGWLGNFRLLIDGSALDLAAPGAAHQGVTLGAGDLVWIDNRADAIENGPYVYTAGGAFARPTAQETLATGALMPVGAGLEIVEGERYGTYKLGAAESGQVDSYGLMVIEIGVGAVTVAAADGLDLSTHYGAMVTNVVTIDGGLL
jgi:hypothetical protein